jgi:hypothetical protein
MDDPDDFGYRRKRQTFLAVFLGSVFLIGLLFVFTILTGGFLIYILAVVAVVAVVGGLHYLLWGRAMMEGTAGEREELEERERGEDEGEWLDETRRPRHY